MATYTDSEVAHVGMYDWEAEKAGVPVDTFVHALADTDRGRADASKMDLSRCTTEAEAIRKEADAYNRTRLTPTVAKLFKMWFGWRR